MGKYTLASLIKVNEEFAKRHDYTQNDADKVNKWVDAIENSRNSMPQSGDIVEYTDLSGKYYENSHIEMIQDDRLHICTKPGVPLIGITKSEGNIFAVTTGDCWAYIPKYLELIGTREKLFEDTGGYGKVEFYANVNVWEYKEIEKALKSVLIKE